MVLVGRKPFCIGIRPPFPESNVAALPSISARASRVPKHEGLNARASHYKEAELHD